MQKKYLFTALLALTTAAPVAPIVSYASTANYDSTGTVGFVPGTEVTPPVNPEAPNPNTPVKPVNPDGTDPKPGTAGPLSIDFASSLDFGTHPISNKDQTYSAKAQAYSDGTKTTPDYVQVTDNRGTNAGWILKVVEANQFTEVGQGKNPELKGAVISLKNPIPDSNGDATAPVATDLKLVPGQEQVLATATTGSGAGTWVIHWGDTKNLTQDANGTLISPDVQLFVPGSTVKDAAKYTTTLNWILSELPNN